jgi:hypothetical protein
LSTEDTANLLDISSDYEPKMAFRILSLINIWLSVRKEYPLLGGKAATTSLPLSTTYLCEKAFSSCANLKTKHRRRLNAEPDLRLHPSPVVPEYQALRSSTQAHPSH